MYICLNCGHETMNWTPGAGGDPIEYWCPVCSLHLWPGQDCRDDDVIYGSFSLRFSDYGLDWIPAWLPVPDAPESADTLDETLQYWPAGWFGWEWERLLEQGNGVS